MTRPFRWLESNDYTRTCMLKDAKDADVFLVRQWLESLQVSAIHSAAFIFAPCHD